MVINMADITHLKAEINFKLENIKILTSRKKIRELIDEILFEDLPKLYKLIERKKWKK